MSPRDPPGNEVTYPTKQERHGKSSSTQVPAEWEEICVSSKEDELQLDLAAHVDRVMELLTTLNMGKQLGNPVTP